MTKILFRDLFQIPHRVEVRINVTNACNLHCDFCDHDAHLPFAGDGAKIYRRTPLVATPESIEQFCRVMAGVGEDERHVLQGGEITVLPVRLIVRYIDTLHAAGRCVGMRTNGYNLTGIPAASLNKLAFIYLNSHGANNQEAIDACHEHLKQHYRGQVILEENYHHRDLTAYLHHHRGTVEQGLACSHLLATLTFQPPVVHPCCNSWALMNALNTTEMEERLIESGWTADNPNLRNTLADWRRTLPPQFLKSFCADSCYLTAPDDAYSPLYQIGPHPADKILKRAKGSPGDHLV
jgi:hypothetical protein